jgi:predicted RNase H-like HicB family nuclease
MTSPINSLKIIIEKHEDGYVAYPLGLKGVVVGQGDSYDEALADVTSAVNFHIETFGMYGKFKHHLENTLDEIREAGLFKNERIIEGPQDAHIDVNGREVLNMCANNYLGLSDHPAIVEAARKSLGRMGLRLVVSAVYLRDAGDP